MRLPVFAAAFLMATPAMAEEGLYVSAGGGLNLNPDLSVDLSAPGATASGDLGTNAGFGFIGAVGYQLATMPGLGSGVILGAEGEIGYRQNGVDDISGTLAVAGLGAAAGTLDLDGDLNALTFMGNGRAGLDLDGFVTPFVTAGAGLARVGVSGVSAAGVSLLDDEDWVFAYQVGGGVNVALSEWLSAEATYRYLGTTDVQLTATDNVTQVESSYHSHSVFVVLKYTFGGM